MATRDTITGATGPTVRYFFVVARDRPDILARVTERLQGDARIDVIVDRRCCERRTSVASRAVDRRRAERRRPTTPWDDLSVYPTLVAPQRVESYAELHQRVLAGARESNALRDDAGRQRAENDRLRHEVERLAAELHMLRAADATFRRDAAAILAQAEQSVGAMIARFEALMHAQERDPAGRG